MTNSIRSGLGFMSPEGVHIDTQRPGGVLRAPTRSTDPNVYPLMAKHECTIQDLCNNNFTAIIDVQGFEKVRINHLKKFQHQLATLSQLNHLTPQHALQLDKALIGRKISLQDNRSLRILFVAHEGTMMRVTGPNGLIIDAESTEHTGINHKIGAPAVHGDQDVRGVPVRQILKGLGPHLLNHEAPDGRNRRSPLFLINLWIPLQQITQPLVLMDESSWNRKAHQLRYALPVSHFLEREEDRKMNDIWTVLHHPEQQWHFSSQMDNNEAYIFNTLSNPHGATTLPGEDRAEQLYLALQAACDGKPVPVVNIPLHPDCPKPLHQAISHMENMLNTIQSDAAWIQRAKAAMDSVVRKSIEMRMLAFVY